MTTAFSGSFSLDIFNLNLEPVHVFYLCAPCTAISFSPALGPKFAFLRILSSLLVSSSTADPPTIDGTRYLFVLGREDEGQMMTLKKNRLALLQVEKTKRSPLIVCLDLYHFWMTMEVLGCLHGIIFSE